MNFTRRNFLVGTALTATIPAFAQARSATPNASLVKVALRTEFTEARFVAIFTEREELLMTAALAFAYVNLCRVPKQGYDIAALMAWNVEDVRKTPEFILGHNKNFENRGDVYHAEVNT